MPLLLLEVSQLLLAGARLGVQVDFVPSEQFEPDAGPDPDLDAMRERLATLLEGVDDFTEVFDPYIDPPELVSSQSVRRPRRHRGQRRPRPPALPRAAPPRRRCGGGSSPTSSSWGAEASASLRALQSVIAHDRLDASEVGEVEASRVAAAQDL